MQCCYARWPEFGFSLRRAASGGGGWTREQVQQRGSYKAQVRGGEEQQVKECEQVRAVAR